MNDNVIAIKEQRFKKLGEAFKEGVGRKDFKSLVREAVENDNAYFSINLDDVQFKKTTEAIDGEFLTAAFEQAKALAAPVPLIGMGVRNYSVTYGVGSNLQFFIREPNVAVKVLDKVFGVRRVF